MYELVKRHEDDKDTLKLLADILWALEFDLELDSYRYHYLAEFAGLDKSAPGFHKYIESIEEKIKELKSNKYNK